MVPRTLLRPSIVEMGNLHCTAVELCSTRKSVCPAPALGRPNVHSVPEVASMRCRSACCECDLPRSDDLSIQNGYSQCAYRYSAEVSRPLRRPVVDFAG